MLQVSEAIVQRSSRPEVLFTKGALKDFAKLTGKRLCQSLFFNKVADLIRPVTLLKMGLWHRCFPVDFAKFLRTPFFYRTPPVAVSEVYFSSDQRNILCEYKLHGKPTMK